MSISKDELERYSMTENEKKEIEKVKEEEQGLSLSVESIRTLKEIGTKYIDYMNKKEDNDHQYASEGLKYSDKQDKRNKIYIVVIVLALFFAAYLMRNEISKEIIGILIGGAITLIGLGFKDYGGTKATRGTEQKKEQ